VLAPSLEPRLLAEPPLLLLLLFPLPARAVYHQMTEKDNRASYHSGCETY
jgi:hypothetical protein